MSEFSNPYSDQHFFGFFWVLFQRILHLLSGKSLSLAADEIQMGVLMCLAISGALVGSFLVLRRMTMLANALSHTILFGIVVAYLVFRSSDSHEILSLPFLGIVAMLTGLLTAILTESLTRVLKLQEDASIGLVFTVLFASGIVLVTLFTRNVHIGTELVMGNVDALQKKDLTLSASILLINTFLFLLFFKEQKIATFDRNLSQVIGFSPLLFNYLLMIQTAGTVVGAFRAIGIVMILAFLVIPVLIARMLVVRLPLLIGIASMFGCLASVFGVALSRHLLSVFHIGLSTGGIVVCLLIVFFIAAFVFCQFKQKRIVSLD